MEARREPMRAGEPARCDASRADCPTPETGQPVRSDSRSAADERYGRVLRGASASDASSPFFACFQIW